VNAPRPGAAQNRERRSLTPAEEELFLLELQNPADPAYLVPFAVWVDGPLAAPVLVRALSEVVARHEILRTVVRSAGAAPVAEVLPDVEVPIPVVRVASDAEALSEASVLARQTFGEGAVRLRATVFRIHATRWLLVLVLHHAVCDASSLWVLLDELTMIYSAQLAGEAVDLAPAPQFREVCGAQLARAGGDIGELARAAASRVRSAPDVVNLPYEDADKTCQPVEGRLLQLPLSPELNDSVGQTARRLAVSPNAVLLAAYGVLLDVIAGAGDVLVSVPVSRRETPAEQRVVGFLVHSVPVRLRVGECETSDELIEHAWTALRDGWRHAPVSFGRLVAEINPQRVAGMNPLCQCEFSVQTLLDRLPALGPSSLAYQFIHNGGFKFSLSLEVVRSAGTRTIAIEYPKATFRAATVRRMANLYLRVLGRLTVGHPTRLEDLDLVSHSERSWLVEHGGAGQTRAGGAAVSGLAARIEAAIRQQPSGEAVRAAGRSMSYAELGAQAAELAATFSAAGVRPGERIAVLADRGMAAIVAVVAAIRMGASFMAVADDTPAVRLGEMLAAAQPAIVVVTAPQLLAMLPDRWRTAPTRCAAGWMLMAGEEGRAWRPGEAYIVFTSGSTGEPRGVSVPDSAIAAITNSWCAEFGLAALPGRHLQLAPFTFDVFVGDLARSLCFGGTLIVASRDDILDPRRLAELIRRECVDTVELVPAVARLLCDYFDSVGGRLPSLRRVMVGSDIWLSVDALRMRALLPAAARLYCTYGTSETAVDATLFEIEPGGSVDASVVPIGRPFPGVLVSVRDRLGRLLPPCWPGELWIGGATVASGYLADEEADRVRFRTARAPDGCIVRWYRTGDRVRWDPAGWLTLLGRIDSETKIRGVRVHPAEVEAVLCRHPSVTAAAVVATGQPPQRTLMAFITGPSPGELTELSTHARRHLLPAAVPARFHVISQIPTTRHGKVDNQALVRLANSLAAVTGERPEPADSLELEVAAICADALGVPDVPATDDFYALGASSVQVAMLAWRVSVGVDCNISVQDVIEAPSVRELCGLIRDRSVRGGRAVALASQGSKGGLHMAAVPEAACSPSARAKAAVPARSVVLTGVTGNLGPGILRALLDGGASEVTCVARANDPTHAGRRVRTALAAYGADPQLAADPRVRYCVADLAVPGAGLSAVDTRIVAGADAVVNAAAWVNFLYPYDLLAPVNVHGVAALAKLAGQVRIKPLHHLSTRSAVAEQGRQPVGGYNESKAAAERLLLRYRELGLPVCVYRPGFVLGGLAARPNRPGLLESFLRDCLRVGTCPVLPGYLNVVTADHVAVRIVSNVLSLSPSDCLDLVGAAPLRWGDAWEILRGHGLGLREVPVRDWLDQISGQQERQSWFEPFLPLCESVGLVELLSDEPAIDPGPGAQPVADAWQQICAELCELTACQ
jgi:amino acid adenylation domain-containing protein/thioester reductase-like protein